MSALSVPLPILRILLILLSFPPFASGTASAAQEEGIAVRSTADYVYGQSMNFNLDAANVGEVQSITLFFRLGASPDSYRVDVPVENQGSIFSVSYALDLTQTRLPPFSAITYWWQIELVEGPPVRVPEQVVSYVDDQFSWRQSEVRDEEGGGSIRIHWTGDSATVGDQAKEIVLEMLPAISRLVPLDQIVPFDIYIYPSTADLAAALRLAGRDYQPGQTYPDLGVVLATVVNQDTAEQELRHELSRGLTDLMLFQALSQFAYHVPPWLSKGIAGIVRNERDVVLEDTLRSAVRSETTIPFVYLCDGMPLEDNLAVAQSESLVGFIKATYGEKAVHDMVTAFASGENCSAALRAAIQLSPQQLEATWLRGLSSNQNSRTLAEVAVWLVLLLAGFGLSGLLLLPSRRS